MGVTRATKQAPPRQGRSVSPQRTDVTMRPDLFQVMGPSHAAISPVKYSGPKLGKSNWTAFEFAFKMHLKGLGVLGAVENKESKDLRMDNVFSLLVSALEESQLPLIYDAKTPNQAWILLEDAHRSRNAQNLATLSQEFRKAKMKESQTVLEFVLYMEELARKIKAAGNMEIQDLDFFVTTLNAIEHIPKFKVTVECLLNGPLLSKSELKARLQAAEQRVGKSAMKEKEPETALRADGFRNRRHFKPKKAQDHAGSEKKAPPSKDECRKCGQKGHWARGCRNKQESNKTEEKPWSGHDANTVEGEYLFASTQTSRQRSYNEWLMDSGASSHMTCRLDLIQNPRCLKEPIPIRLGNEAVLFATHFGHVKLTSKIILKDVLYVEGLRENLLSTTAACRTPGIEARQTGDEYKILFKGKPILRVKRTKGMFRFIPRGTANSEHLHLTIEDLHRVTGHANYNIVGDMIERKILPRPEEDGKKPSHCVTCSKGKLTRAPIPKTGSRTERQVWELIHSDLCGPMPITSLQGNKYMALYIDDRSNWTHVACIRSKSDQVGVLQGLISKLERQFGAATKTLRTDGGGEYDNKEMKQFLQERGIRWEHSAPRTPQQNGKSERMNRTIIEMARCLLIDSGLPKAYWEYAVKKAAYLRNRTPKPRQT